MKVTRQNIKIKLESGAKPNV